MGARRSLEAAGRCACVECRALRHDRGLYLVMLPFAVASGSAASQSAAVGAWCHSGDGATVTSPAVHQVPLRALGGRAAGRHNGRQ